MTLRVVGQRLRIRSGAPERRSSLRPGEHEGTRGGGRRPLDRRDRRRAGHGRDGGRTAAENGMMLEPSVHATAAERIRVLCVDDHRIVREGIALIIDRQPDMHVVASAASGEEAVAMFRQHRPDVTLMDLQLGAMGGVEAIREIRALDPAARIVVLTMYPRRRRHPPRAAGRRRHLSAQGHAVG